MNTSTRTRNWLLLYLSNEPIAGVILKPGVLSNVRKLGVVLLVTSLAISLLFALIQSSSATNLYFLPSWFFWELHVLFGFLLILLGEWALHGTSLIRSARLAVIMATLPLMLAPVSLLLDSQFATLDLDARPSEGFLKDYLYEVYDIAAISIIVAVTALYTINQSLGEVATRSSRTEFNQKHEDSLVGEIPEKLGSDVIRVSAQDHYCEVVTTLGSHLISRKFSDCLTALTELGGL